MLNRSLRACLLLAAAAATACTSGDRRIAEGDEPIAALQVRYVSRRYDTAFWTAQARESTALWSIALQFCLSEGRDVAAHPNCASVIAADVQTRGGEPRRASAHALAAVA